MWTTTNEGWHRRFLVSRYVIDAITTGVVIYAGIEELVVVVGFGSFMLGMWLPHDIADLIRWHNRRSVRRAS